MKKSALPRFMITGRQSRAPLDSPAVTLDLKGLYDATVAAFSGPGSDEQVAERAARVNPDFDKLHPKVRAGIIAENVELIRMCRVAEKRNEHLRVVRRLVEHRLGHVKRNSPAVMAALDIFTAKLAGRA